MSEVRERIAQCCKRLRLRQLTTNLDLVSEHDPEEFLLKLLELEVEQRNRARVDRAIRTAGFYTPKRLEDFVYDEVTFPTQLDSGSLTELEFITNRQNLILYGNVGTGNYVKSSLMRSRRCKSCWQKDRGLGDFT